MMLSLTAKQTRFEYLTAQLVLHAATGGIELICFRFIATPDEELAHFNAGRSQIDPRVKPTMHMQRLAKDFAVIKDGKFVWERTAEYELLGAMAETLGLRWGGRWVKLNDIYHVEYQEGA